MTRSAATQASSWRQRTIAITNADHQRALEVQAALAERGQHRSLSLVDALGRCRAGQYHGFDVDPEAVAWCQQAYRPFKNFAFAHAPVGYVNVKASAPIRGEEFVFPYPDATVDLAFSVSVYTHLSRTVIDHYLAETSRVLRPGGLCVNTFFVNDEFAADAMRAGRADRSYVDQGDGTYRCDPRTPNLGIGFAPDVIRSLHEAHALLVVAPVRFGTWSGRSVESFVYQDMLLPARRSEPKQGSQACPARRDAVSATGLHRVDDEPARVTGGCQRGE